MEKLSWYDVFLENLNSKFPKRVYLIEELMSLLCIEREAAYRRLRKDVFFPMHEIVKISAAWNISLDEIIGINSGSTPFQMQTLNYLTPELKDIQHLKRKMKILEQVTSAPHSEYMEVCNKLPRPINIDFPILYRFEIFKWAYQYNYNAETNSTTPYSKVIFSEELSQQFNIYSRLIKKITNSSFILDQLIFDHFVQNIKFFHSILLINDEEKELLKSQLFLLLDYITELAATGCYPDTQNKVNIYISQLNINTNYSYYYADGLKLCRINAFGKFDVLSYDTEMINYFRTWMNLKKRSAIQISETNEKSRIEYLTKQRQIIDTL